MKILSKIVFLFALMMSASTNADAPLVFSGIQGSANSNISMRVLKKAYAKLAIDIKYLPLPGERALRTSNSGEIDGEVFRIANVHKRYTNLIQVPTQINVLPGLAFTKNKKIKIDNWQSLKAYRVGIQGGIKFAERGTRGMKPVVVDTNKQLFRMLNSGRIEVAIASQINGLKTLAELHLAEIKALQPAIQIFPLYHYLHKKHAALVPRLDEVLQQMRVSGEIQAIRATYLEQLNQHMKTSLK